MRFPNPAPSSSFSDIKNVSRNISGLVLEDRYGDTVGDEGLVNVVVQLYNEDGILILSTKTDSNGYFLFQNVPSGLYSIVEVTPG